MNDKAYKFSTRDSTEFTVGDEGVQLPEVTADDNGDVLTVVEGTWAKAAPTGGGVLIVHSDESGVLDKTWQEIYDAGFSVLHSDDGTNVFCVRTYEYDGDYIVAYQTFGQNLPYIFIASSVDGYPVDAEASTEIIEG